MSVGLPELDKATRKQLDRAVSYLANTKKSSLKLRQGILNGARVSYFKGRSALASLPDTHFVDLSALNSSSGSHHDDDHNDINNGGSSPRTPTAQDTLEALLLHNYIVRVEKQQRSKLLAITPLQSFDAQDYYVMLYAPTNYKLLLGSVGLVATLLAGVMFPLWPEFARVGVWYLSIGAMGLLGVLVVLAIIRLVIFVPLLLAGKPGWLFPNLWADVGIIESFKPVWEWQAPSASRSRSTNTAAADAAATAAAAADAAPATDGANTDADANATD
ncbi:Translocation protein S62 [Sorochytrium milnesiophthora]